MNVLIVDDHYLIRDALRSIFCALDSSITVLEAADGRTTLQLVGGTEDIDLVVLDLSLPDRNGLELLVDLRSLRPSLSFLILSAEKERSLILRCLELGALGFIPKSAAQPVMINAVRLVLAGGVYVPPEALAAADPGGRASPPGVEHLGLTERQLEVLGLVVQGRSNKWICRALDLAEPTVKHHVSAILKALKVTNRTEAALAAAAFTLPKPRP